MRLSRPATTGVHRESGFTLPELLITITIIGVIVGVLGSALIVNFRTLDVTSKRVGVSSDTQVASAYFSADTANSWRIVGAANYISYAPPSVPTTPVCTDPKAGAIPKLSIGYSWVDSSYQSNAISRVTKAADWVTEGTLPSLTLVRLYCTQPGGVTSRQVMASNLSSTPVIVGDIAGTPRTGATACDTPALTCSLQATVVTADPQQPTGPGTTYQMTLTGTPRINSPPVGGSTGPIPPLLVLCTKTCIPASDTCIDSTCQAPVPPTVANSPVSLDLNDTGSLYVLNPDGTPATNIVVNSPGPVAATAVEGSRVGYLDTGGVFHTVPIVTPMSTSGTCYMDTASTGNLNCPAGGTGTPQADPFSGLASPSTAGLTTYATQSAGCTVTATTGLTTCQPGIYSAPLIISGNAIAAPVWQGGHAYAAGTIVLPTGTNNTHFYKAAVAGTSGGGQPAWPDNTNTVPDGTLSWTDIGVPTTTMASGVYVLNGGMQLGRPGFQDNIVLTTDPNGVLLNFNADGQLLENVKWATVTLNPLTTTSCAQWCDFAGISIFAPILPKCVSPNTVGCWTYNNASPPAPVPHPLDMFVSGAIYTRGIVDAPGDSVTTDAGGDNSNSHFTQIAALIVSSLHIGWPNAILQVGGGTIIAPTITTIAPNFLGQGATNQTITINGSNFDAGAAVTFANPGITLNGPTNYVNGNQVTVSISVSGTAAPGPTSLTVTNPDGSNVVAPGGFTVLAAPTITSLSPNHLGLGATNQTITINGTNFVDGAVYPPGVTASFAGAGIVVNSITRVSSTQLTAVVSVPAGAAVGSSDVTVDNQDKGTTATLTGGFTVVGVPTITSIVPNALGQGQTNQNITVNGTNFINGATLPPGSTVRFANAGVQVNSVAYVSPTQVTVTVNISATAVPGPGSVTVDNRDAGTTVTLANGFTVLASPTVTSVSPTAGPVGGGTPVTISGTNFTGATQVLFGATAVAAFTVVSPTQITTTSPTIATGATTVDVTVTTPANTSAVTRPADQFTYGGPSVTSVAPNGGPVGGGTSVIITGTGFTINSTVTFGGMPATTLTLNSSTQITATTPAQAAATIEVVVTTPGGISPSNPPADQFTYENPPTVTSVSPTAGAIGGGTTVTITGTNFFGTSAASFGAAPGAGFIVNGTGTQITVTTPAHAAGTVDVTVTTPGGTSVLNPIGDLFAFGVPTVTLLSPNGGPPGGGTPVTITGNGFTAGSTVTFGGIPVAATVVSGTQITANSATVGGTGVVDVLVSNPVGPSAPTFVDRFTYEGVPTVTSVTPTAGPAGGGASVTITGNNFYGTTAVSFGATPGSNVSVNGAGTVVTVTSPTGTTGTVDIQVTTPVGQSALNQPADEYTFGAPTVTAVTPSAGLIGGGTTVTISGTGFTTDATVSFGGSPGGTVTFVSPTSLTVTSPPHAPATVDVTVTTPAGTSVVNAPADQFTFGPPVVTLVSPNGGPVGGGTPVTITGTGFTAGAAVTFGGIPAIAVTVISSTQITVTSPAVGSTGIVDVQVTTSGGTSAPTFVDRFTFEGAPTVTGISPPAGISTGGTTVVITGTNFTGVTQVLVGANPATGVTFNSATQITMTTPAGAAGIVDITVVTPVGTSATSSADGYTYDGIPTVTAVTPVAGNTTGGTTVTVSGTGLLSATAVTFSGAPAATFTAISDTQITLTTPVHAAGLVDVIVTNPTGTSAVVPADKFTFQGAPTITAVNPVAGTTTGGTSVVITGTNFTAATQVVFGATAATTFAVNTTTQITATAPAQAAGQIDVSVSTPIANSALVTADHYTYDGTPTVTAINPVIGNTTGGTSVTITGTGFLSATAVSFGGTAGTGVTITSDTSLTVTSPGHAAGQVDVTVTNPTGTSALVAADRFTFQGAPTVTTVNPVAGRTTGGTSVVITGTNFTAATQVFFGATAATTFTVNTATQITATSPAHAAGQVDVTVVTPIGTSAIAAGDKYTYDGTPTVTAINPVVGNTTGGTSVTITGTGFLSASAVTFGGTAGTGLTVTSDTSLSVTSPAHAAGQVDVTVTNPTGTSALVAADRFTFQGAPTVTTVNPVAGRTTGGTSVVITGTNFTAATQVFFGATAATTFTVNTATQITATSPAEAAGQVDVTVVTPVATSATSAADRYTFDAVPTVTAINPILGNTTGGTTVTVTGTGFLSTTAVTFGGIAGTGVTITSDTSLTVTSPGHAAGQVDVTVTNPSGTSAAVAADKFTFQGAPTVTAVNPVAGTTAGGTSVVITGTNFTAATQVFFGATAATTYTVNTATQITATSPAHAAGQVDATVTTPIGTSVVVATDHYTYDTTPTVTSVIPVVGNTTGGTTVTVTGTGFLTATAVTFGGTAGTGLTVNSDTSITVTSPAHGAGQVDVSVTSPTGTSAVVAADKYTFQGAPTVTAVNPVAGTTTGGTTVIITGTNFTGATQVLFGATAATTFTVNTATQITATTAARAAGQVDVTVTTPVGISGLVAADRYTYDATPTVTVVNPLVGVLAGGNTVTVTGTGFLTATGVRFGATAGTVVTILSDTSLTVTAPAHAAGQVDVTVTNPTGTSGVVAADHYTYDTTPTVTVVNPLAGVLAGGNTVTVTGTGFLTATGVNFGATAGTVVTILSDTSLTVTAPAHAAGQVDVTVTNTTGTSAVVAADHYTYDTTPTVTAVSPLGGGIAGTNTVTVTGTGFLTATGVRFAATAGTVVTILSDTSLTVTAPAHAAGQIDVTVTNTTGTSAIVAADHYTYDGVPTVTLVAPVTGTHLGGTSVVITGTGFLSATGVDFSGTAAVIVTITSDTSMTVTSPVHAIGNTDIHVTNPAGTSAQVRPADRYAFT